MSEPLKLHKGTADDFLGRYLPGGAEQDISADLITVDFARAMSAPILLTLTSANANEVEKLSAESQGSTAVTSITSTSEGAIIEAVGATFVDNEVLKNEEITITGDAAGTYTVKQVISNTKVQVFEAIASDPAPSATIVVRRGEGWFKVKLDIADIAVIDSHRTGVAVVYRTPSGGEKRFLFSQCYEFEEVPE